MRVLTARQMRDADRRTIDGIGIPSAVLMENAGRQVVTAIDAAFDDLEQMHVAVVCGPGNNGGDGFVAARVLIERSIATTVYLVAQASAVKGDARINLDVLHALGVDVVEIADGAAWELHGGEVTGADLIVDAIFGTGLKAPLEGLVATIVNDINAAAVPVVAIDLPSGLSADVADVIGPAIRAGLTVTLGAPKLPLLLPPAESLAGRLTVADIGIPRQVIDELEGPRVEVLTKETLKPLVRTRSPESHKGDFGRVLVVGGSAGKTGAPHLSAMAALRSGAGLVTIATPASCVPIVASLGAEYMTIALPETADHMASEDAADLVLGADADVIAIGPGLGRSSSTGAFVRALVGRATTPLVLDADALFAFAGSDEPIAARDGVDVVITPHPGEMARLLGVTTEQVQARRLDVARDFAASRGVHVVLKGHRTIVASPGGDAFINLTGKPGMATGGTGDVLTGMVAAWCAQLLDAEAAAKLAVFLHGLAGDLSEADEGEIALVAGDLIVHLGDAVLELTGRRLKPQPES
jgi:NAD(P)H-hydrate epimerase